MSICLSVCSLRSCYHWQDTDFLKSEASYRPKKSPERNQPWKNPQKLLLPFVFKTRIESEGLPHLKLNVPHNDKTSINKKK